MVPKVLTGQKVVLREKRITDAANDYGWRCDSELSRLDGVSPLKLSPQEYIANCTEELRHSSGRRRRFAIDSLNGKHIGNCMYYDIDKSKRQAEMGILIGDREYWNKGYGADAVTTLVCHIFEETSIERVYLNTLEWNVRAQRCFQRCGFIACGRVTKRGNNFLTMELHRSWMKPIKAKTKA